jgi:hypothetical protein
MPSLEMRGGDFFKDIILFPKIIFSKNSKINSIEILSEKQKKSLI